MLAVGMLMQCGGATTQDHKEQPPQQAPASNAKSAEDGCDFSAYAPVLIKYFDPKAVIRRVQPEYPREAVVRGIEGQVIVKALVNEKGFVERTCTVKGEEILRYPAEKAALQWKLKPGYGLAFLRPKTRKNPKNFAEVYIVFGFKLNKPNSTRKNDSAVADINLLH
jgi:hypothetical protein